MPSASADVAAASAGTHLHRRDALWAAALQTAISRRTGDIGALQQHWYAAMEALAEYSLDLFALLPLGELWVAAARMRQVDQLQHTLDQALTLLDSLGNPALWSNSLHWAGVHAGILANSPESVAPHGQALGAMVAHSTLAQALSDAGRTWLRVLAENVDADEVTAAARSLSHVGLTSDATRLAGQAALQTSDARVSGAMLQLARDLKLGNDFGEPQRGRRHGTSFRYPAGTAPATGGLAAIRSRTRSRRATATGHALSRHWRPAVHLSEDGRAPRRPDTPAAGRWLPVGDVVDAAGHAGPGELNRR